MRLKTLGFKNFTPKNLLIFYASKKGIFATVQFGFWRYARTQIYIQSLFTTQHFKRQVFYLQTPNSFPLTHLKLFLAHYQTRVCKYPQFSVPDRVGYTRIFWVGFSGFSGIEQSQRTTSKPASNLIKITFLEMARPNESIYWLKSKKHQVWLKLGPIWSKMKWPYLKKIVQNGLKI